MKILTTTRFIFLILALVVAPLQGYAATADSDVAPCHDVSAIQDSGDMDCQPDNSCNVDQQCTGSCSDCGACSTISFVPSINTKIDSASHTEQIIITESFYPQPPSFVEPRPPSTSV